MRDVMECTAPAGNGTLRSWASGQAYECGNQGTGRALMVRESDARYDPTGRYESEGSERRSLGSVPVATDARWTATLTVPMPSRAVAFFQVERRGELPAGYRGAEESAFLSLPIGEVDALIALVTGVIAQARRDGVLPAE
jgi:hypothetical protein